MPEAQKRITSILMLWITAALFLVSTTSLVFYFADKWQTWRPATCMPDGCFCEQIRSGSVAQPANTWSSLSFVFVGLAILFEETRILARNPRSKHSAAEIASPVVLGVYVFSLMMIGMGSAFYHASLTFAGQFFDVMGMYLFITFVILLNFSRLKKLSGLGFAGGFIITNFALAYVLIVFPEFRRYIFGGLVAAAVALEFIVRKKNPLAARVAWLHGALSAFGLAFLIWTLDITKIACEPASWMQGHAAWHILGAVAGGMLYSYYRSESLVRRD